MLQAALRMNATPEAEALLIDTGDILLSGPNQWGIHHVILARSPMQPAPEARKLGVVDQDVPVFTFRAIESSDVKEGHSSPWFAAQYFVIAAPVTSELQLVGSRTEGLNTLGVFRPFASVKVLQHPLRAGRGGPKFNAAAFEHAVAQLETTSKGWSLKTALSALPSGNETINVAALSGSKSRAELLEQIRESWEKPPICSSVAIAVWQCYFCLTTEVQQDADDAAVLEILQYMPVRCGLAMPSQLVKSLGHCGWQLVTHSEELHQLRWSKRNKQGCCGWKVSGPRRKK